jgi:uncharacterized membrane protein
MITLYVAAAVFFAIHALVSGTPVRARLVKAMGERTYLGLFSLASVAALWWLATAYGAAKFDSANTFFWDGEVLTKQLAAVIQLFAFCLAAPGLLTRSPTAVMQGAALASPDAGGGVLRITRHPFLWGVALWAGAHLLVNGELADLVFFGLFMVTALLGTVSIDRKRRAAYGDQWTAFAARTSNVPFLAIVSGRTPLKVEEIGWWRIAAALAIYAAVLLSHESVFGVSPLS